MKKEKIKVGDIVEHWGIDFTPDPWYKRLYWLAFRGFSCASFFFREKVFGRIKYGFPPYEAHDFFSYHAKWCIKRLKFLRNDSRGYPASQTSLKKWHDILDKIIWSFENVSNQPDPIKPPNYDGRHRAVIKQGDSIVFENVDSRPWDWAPVKKHKARVQKGLNLFAKYYTSLWD